MFGLGSENLTEQMEEFIFRVIVLAFYYPDTNGFLMGAEES